MKKQLLFSFAAFSLLAQLQSVTELKIELPSPPSVLRSITPGQIIRQTVTEIRDIFVPPVCPAPETVPSTCNLTLRDVEDPSNTFVLGGNCLGRAQTCALYMSKDGKPREAVGLLKGNFSASLDLDEIAATAVTYQLYDQRGQFCDLKTAHTFRVGAPGAATPTLAIDQSAYRFFANADSVTAGAALAALNTAPTVSPDTQFRLRLLMHADDVQMETSETFKLQWGTLVSTCAAISSWTDVAASGSDAIQYYNNTTPSDGTALGTTANDPTHGSDTVVDQTYEEANNFTPSTAVPAGEDGHWDFSLQHFFGDTGFPATTYCLRAVKSDGAALDSYTAYPTINVE